MRTIARSFRVPLALALASILAAPPAAARTVRIPAGTTVYLALDEEVTSRKKDTEQGESVRASVWRDVVVDGVTVVRAGTPARCHVGMVRSAKIAGVQGKLDIQADNVPLADGHEMRLEGGYDKRGRGRKAVSITLAAVVLAPLIFIKGKQAVLPQGTVFDSYTVYDRDLETDAPAAPRVVKLAGRTGPSLSVEVQYEALERDEKAKTLPMTVSACGAGETMPPLRIDRVNGEPLSPPVRLAVKDARTEGSCTTARTEAPLDPLGKVFRRGLNTFDVAADVEGDRVSTEILLEIEF